MQFFVEKKEVVVRHQRKRFGYDFIAGTVSNETDRSNMIYTYLVTFKEHAKISK